MSPKFYVVKRESMADAKVNLTVTDSSGSIDKTTKKAKELKSQLQEAATAASKVNTPSALMAAKGGLAASGPKPAAARAKADSEASGTSRGVGGATGAAGRDFAKLASGDGNLGGLVQIYATFAANIFAASAAFTALSKAADITNLVKGLDQLGAAGGRNLGALSKQLVAVTDGAINLEESLRSVANASAGGLSDANILRLANVAKTASQALGVAMPDAVSRLTRGITKLEPELLDEIGIMVRLDDAVSKYAASVGKSATALSDFERRQAFANAVLEQGEKKFGAINLEVNPYAKLLASVQNLAFSVGETINKFLGPFINLLNSSPTALAGALALITTTLLKQAIPALTEWRSRLNDYAENSRKVALESAKNLASKAEERTMYKLLGKEIEAVTKAQSTYIQLTTSGKYLKSTKSMLPDLTSNAGIKAANADLLDAQAKKVEGLIQEKNLSERVLKNRQDEVATLKKLAAETRAAQAAIANYDKLENDRRNASLIDRAKYYFSDEGISERNLNKQANRSMSASIRNQAISDAPEKGALQAWREMRLNIAAAKKGQGDFIVAGQKMTTLTAITTSVSGGFRLLGGAVASLATSLSAVFFYVGIATAAFAILKTTFSRNAKEVEALDINMSALAATGDNLNNTLGAIAKKSSSEVISTKSTEAAANAFLGLNDSLAATVDGLDKAIKKAGSFDRALDFLLDRIGFGIADNISDAIAGPIVNGILAIEDPKLRQKYQDALQNIIGTGVNLSNRESVQDYFDDLSSTQQLAKLRKVEEVTKLINSEVQVQASRIKEASASISELGTKAQENIAKLTPKDDFSTFGEQLLNIGKNFNNAFDDPINRVTLLRDLLSNVNALSVLSPETSAQLIQDKKALDDLNKSLGEATTKLKSAELRLVNADEGSPDARIAQYDIKQAQARISALKTDIDAKTVKFQKLGADIVAQGNEKILQGLTRSLKEASIIVTKGTASILGSLGASTSNIDRSVAQQEAQLQLEVIDSQYALVEQLTKNTLALEKNSLTIKISELSQKGNKRTEEETKTLTNALQTFESIVLAQQTLTNTNQKDLPKTIAGLASSGQEAAVGAANALSSFNSKTVGREAQRAKVFAELSVTLLGVDVKQLAEQFGKAASLITKELDSLAIGEAELSEYNTALGTLSGINLEKRKTLELNKQELQQAKELVALGENIAKNQLIISNSRDADVIASAKENIARLEAERTAKLEDGARARAVIEQKYERETFEFKLQQQEFFQSIEDRLTETSVANQTAALDLEMSRLGNLSQMSSISEEFVAREEYRLNLIREELSTKVKLSAIERKLAAEKLKLERALGQAQLNNDPNGEREVLKQLAALDKAAKAERASVIATSKARMSGLESVKDTKLELIQMEKILDKQKSIVESIATVFGSIGEGLSGVFDVFFDYQNKLKDLEAQRDNAQFNARDTSAWDKAELEFIEKKQELDEKASLSAIANSKKLFKEKTTAYKAIDALEKFMHMQKLLRDVQEIASDQAKTSSSIGGSIARGVADGAAAVAKTLASIPFPFNIAAAAAVAVIVKKLFGKGPNVGGFAPNAEQRQEVQGTGLSYDSKGNKVENGTGIFGDASAKSASIENSLRILKENSIEGLDYSNKMVELLTSINENIGGVSKSLYTVGGLRTGSLFGNSDVSTSKSGISGLFGSSTTRQIYDSGIKFVGSFIDILNNRLGSIQGFETIQKTKKSSGFLGLGGSTKVSYNTQFANLSQEVSNDIASIFNEATNLFIESGIRLGMTVEDVYSKLARINVNQLISLRGLKGEELEKEVVAVISSILDTTASSLFANLKKYAEFGEGMLETTIRIIDTNDKINLALESIGKVSLNTSEILTESSIAISQALAKSAGSLETFVQQTNFFKDNFLTQAEQIKPIQERLEKELENLGLNSAGLDPVDTREEFASIVKAIDLTTESGRALYQSMMDIADIFALVYPETRELLSVEDLRKALLKQQIEILKLEGKVSESVALQRKTELDAMDDLLKAGQQYIWDLTDKLNLLKLESSLLSTLGYTYEALVISRKLELRTLTDQEKAIKESIFAAEDYANTQELLLQIMELSGQELEAETERRLKELSALSSTDAALKARIFQLQDEKKLLDEKRSQDITINELLGNSEEALRLQREQELESTDARLRANQLYIYALEDEAAIKDSLIAAYEAESNSLKDVISTTKNFVQSLKEARDSLLVGDLSILTPSEQYQKLKSDAMTVAAIATGIANTDAEKQAKDEALSKLPDITSQFLEASRTLFASSNAYTEDFNYVLSILNSTTGALETQVTEAEKQLMALEQNTAILSLIQENTLNTNEAILKLVEAQEATAQAAAAAAATNISVQPLSRSDLPEMAASMFNAALEALSQPDLGLNKPDIDLSLITNNATANTDAIITELRLVQAELKALREDQNEQTGHIVESISESANTVAESNSTVVNSIKTNTQWDNTRNYVEAA